MGASLCPSLLSATSVLSGLQERMRRVAEREREREIERERERERAN